MKTYQVDFVWVVEAVDQEEAYYTAVKEIKKALDAREYPVAGVKEMSIEDGEYLREMTKDLFEKEKECVVSPLAKVPR